MTVAHADDVLTGAASPPTGGMNLRGLIARQARRFALGAGFLLVTTLASAVVPQFVRGATNAILSHDARRGMTYALWIVAFALIGGAMRVASRIYIFNVGRDIEFEIRSDMLAHLHKMGPTFFRRMPPGEVMSRATSDIGQVRLLLGFGALNVVNVAVAYAGNIPLMLYRSPLLTLCALAPFPLMIFIVRVSSRSLFTRSKATQDALGELADRAQQTLSGMRVVRAYQLEAHESREFDAISQRALDANLALARLRGMILPIVGGSVGASSLVVLWVGGGLVVQGRLTIGDILAFQAHLALIAWPTIALGYLLTIVQRGRASIERLNDIFRAQPEVRDHDAVESKRFDGEIRVEHLNYEIDERPILRDVSFHVPAGTSVAIVGKTGSGKSTLAALLVRMLPTPPKSVMLDGQDITALPLVQLRRAVNLAQQEPFLFSTTVARNIGFCLDDADTPDALLRVRDAASEAQILEETKTMENGLDTIVGERGVQLSGGQKQRVALARALLASPTVLILDDPLSAVDARTEVAILDAIERAAAGRTLVLVTHRVAAAARCSQIIVLDAGRVVEQGTHEQLARGGGLYSRLAERQALEAELESI